MFTTAARTTILQSHLPNNTVVTDEDVDAILLRSVDGGDGIYGGDVVTIGSIIRSRMIFKNSYGASYGRFVMV